MKFSYCSIRSRDSICIALQLQLPLLNLLLFIAPDYIIHTVADTVFPTLCLKQLIQLCGMWRITAVNIMIALFIQSAFSRENNDPADSSNNPSDYPAESCQMQGR